MSSPEHGLVPHIIRLAAAHDLALNGASVSVNELGLDFRVAIAETLDGEAWVLRIPRRHDVIARAEIEARLLQSVAPHLSAAVPDWRIHTDELIAYPLLPGKPGLTLDEAGAPVWHFDVASLTYAESLGDLLAELHAIDPAEVRDTGVVFRTSDETRQSWESDIETVAAEFDIAGDLRDRWQRWLNDDSYWPDQAVVTHGEIYAAHTLIRDERISAVLDWTTASVGDPAKDFMFQQVTAPPEVFDATVQRYVERGGKVWPRLAEHCAEIFAASPVPYGLFALQTGDPEHRQAAAAQLKPQ